MRGRLSNSGTWTTDTANDNEPSREVAAEGVLHCLRFLATEAEHLGYATVAADVLRAVYTLQTELDLSRDPTVVSSGQNVLPGERLPPVRAPGI